MNNTDVAALIYQELLKVAGGATLMLAALSALLGKIWISRIANREAKHRETEIAELKAQLDRQGSELKAQLDIVVQRTIFVDKMQFEHEYEIYRKAWEKLFSLQRTTLRLRPMLDHVDPDAPKEDRMRKRIGEFRQPYNEFSTLLETSKPFYSEKVYTALIAVRDKCSEEVIDYEYTERSHKEYWAEARKNQEEILSLINLACEAIRSRIAEVRVV